MHSTNYSNLFIEVSEDCKAERGTVPPGKGKKTIAEIEYELIGRNPYRYTSDEVLWKVHAERNGIPQGDSKKEEAIFFSKPQACLRSSPLGKTYGWGIHHDGDSRVALFAKESEDYRRLSMDPTIQHVKAMRNSRK